MRAVLKKDFQLTFGCNLTEADEFYGLQMFA